MQRGAFFLTIAAIAAPAFAKPNFTGNWKLNLDKSELGSVPVYKKFESKVAHSDPEMRVAAVQVSEAGEVATDWVYNTEGKETENSYMGNPVRSTATWEGDVLVVRTRIRIADTDVDVTDRWTLADEGKTLKLQSLVKTPQGDLNLLLIFAKQ